MALDWNMLPLELLEVVALKLETLEDLIYFSVVCRLWNSVSSSIKHDWKPIQVPWLLLPENKKENPDCVRKIFNPVNGRCYQLSLPETFGARCWGSIYGWVAMLNRDLSVQLFNPITKAQIHFPSILSIISPETVFREVRDKDEEEDVRDNEDSFHMFLRVIATKLVVLKVSQRDHDEFVIMFIHGLEGDLIFARDGDHSWTVVDTEFKIVDVVGVGNRAFALYDDGAIVQWNVMEERHGLHPIKPMDYSPSADPGIFEELNKERHRVYLVQSGTDLLMVLRYKQEVGNSDDTDYDYDVVYETVDFHVFKFTTNKKWEKVEDLGDVALFVGAHSSMSILVNSTHNLRHNCIYFTDDEYGFWTTVTKFGGHDMGVFDIETEEFLEEFYEGDDIRSSFCPATFFIPQL